MLDVLFFVGFVVVLLLFLVLIEAFRFNIEVDNIDLSGDDGEAFIQMFQQGLRNSCWNDAKED